MRYDFLVETYDTERLKVISVWSEFLRYAIFPCARTRTTPAVAACMSRWCTNA